MKSAISFLILILLLVMFSACPPNVNEDDDDDSDAVDDDDTEDDDDASDDDSTDDDTGDDDDTLDDDSTDDDDTSDDDDMTDDDDTTDSTWTDPTIDLMWEKSIDDSYLNYADAVSYCDSLTLDGYSDWRVPTIDELRTFVVGCDATESDGSCGVKTGCLEYACKDTSCEGCTQDDGPSDGCYWPSDFGDYCQTRSLYWSSSEVTGDSTRVWRINYRIGSIGRGMKSVDDTTVIRCVRDDS